MRKITTTGHGLLIGIPTLGRPLTLDWAMAFKSLCPPINYNSNHMIVKNQPVDIAREAIAEQAVSQGHKYLFFLGDDVVVPPNTKSVAAVILRSAPPEIVIAEAEVIPESQPAPIFNAVSVASASPVIPAISKPLNTFEVPA